MSTEYLVDRLWPDPAAGLELDAVAADLAPPEPRAGRPWVGVNMVTSIDGRAQLAGTAEGLSGRADRRLLQLYRAACDAVATGVGTLRADDFHSRLAGDLADRRVAAGRGPQPVAVLMAGSRPIPAERGWFAGAADQRRIAIVGAGSPHGGPVAVDPLPGVETWSAPDDVPTPEWMLARLADEGVTSLLLEGGPTLNAAFLAVDAIDELYWTIGARLVGAASLPMVGPSPGPSVPREARLLTVHRAGDELFLRYRVAAGVADGG